MRTTSCLALPVLVVFLAAPSPASAGGNGSIEAHTGGALSYAVCSDGRSGTECATPLFSLGVTATRRLGVLGLGGSVEADTALVGESHLHVGGLAGLSLRPTDRFQFDLLGELGGHVVGDIGEDLFAESSGGSVLLPSVGLRAGWTARLGRSFLLGMWILGRNDLGEREVDVHVRNWFLLRSDQQHRYRVGGASLALGIRLGAAL